MSQIVQDVFFVALVAIGFVAFFRGFDSLLKWLGAPRRSHESSRSVSHEK